MATVVVWLLTVPGGAWPLQAPPVTASTVTCVPSTGVQLGERIAERFVGSLRHRYCFLGDAELSALKREIATFAARYAPSRMLPAEQDALLEAVERYVGEHFSNPPLYSPYRSLFVEETYLMFRDVVNTFKWQLWQALTRGPLTREQQAKRREQHDWLREFIAGVPPRPQHGISPSVWPEDPNAWARADLERELANPLGLLGDPLTREQFEAFQVWMRRNAANGLLHTVAGIPTQTLIARTYREIDCGAGMPFLSLRDFALPFEDDVVGFSGGGAGPHLVFASNVEFRGQEKYVDGRSRPVLEVLKDVARLVLGQPRRVGDIAYDDKTAQLIVLDGARAAELDVADWIEADALSDAELRQVVKDHGARRVSVERLPPTNRPHHWWMYEPRFFLVVRDRTDRLAVIDLRSRGSGQLRLVIRERSKNSAQ